METRRTLPMEEQAQGVYSVLTLVTAVSVELIW
jgi:hypothetical protein